MDESPDFFLGIGVSGLNPSPDIILCIKDFLREAASEPIVGIATFDKKRNHPLINALATEFKAPLFLFSSSMLEAQKQRLATPCARLYARIGCHSVAEAAALAAAGEQARLVIPKTICHKVSFAVAG